MPEQIPERLLCHDCALASSSNPFVRGWRCPTHSPPTWLQLPSAAIHVFVAVAFVLNTLLAIVLVIPCWVLSWRPPEWLFVWLFPAVIVTSSLVLTYTMYVHGNLVFRKRPKAAPDDKPQA